MPAGGVTEPVAGVRHCRHHGPVEAPIRVGKMRWWDAQPAGDLAMRTLDLCDDLVHGLVRQQRMTTRVGTDMYAGALHLLKHVPIHGHELLAPGCSATGLAA